MHEINDPNGVEDSSIELAEYVSLVAHELSNHLNGIVLQAAILKSAVGPEALEDLAIVRKLSQAAAALIRRLQHVNRGPPESVTTTDLNLLVHGCRERWADSNCSLPRLDLADDMPPVQTAPAVLERLLHLLIGYALSVTNPKGEGVIVRTRKNGTEAIVIVEDSGSNVPPEQVPRIFEPFTTVREGANDSALAVCKMLARRIRASLDADSRPEGGMRFTLKMPCGGD